MDHIWLPEHALVWCNADKMIERFTKECFRETGGVPPHGGGWRESLPQVNEFLGIFFPEWCWDGAGDGSSSVMTALLGSVVVKKKLSWTAKLWISGPSMFQRSPVFMRFGSWLINQILDPSGWNKLSLQGGQAQPDRVRTEELHQGGARNKAAAALHQNDSAEVVWASDQDACCMPLFRGFPGISLVGSSGDDPDLFEGLCIFWPGMPRSPPRGAEKYHWGRERSGFFFWTCFFTQINLRRWRWFLKKLCHFFLDRSYLKQQLTISGSSDKHWK